MLHFKVEPTPRCATWSVKLGIGWHGESLPFLTTAIWCFLDDEDARPIGAEIELKDV